MVRMLPFLLEVHLHRATALDFLLSSTQQGVAPFITGHSNFRVDFNRLNIVLPANTPRLHRDIIGPVSLFDPLSVELVKEPLTSKSSPVKRQSVG